MEETKKVVRQEEGERQNESMGMNRPRSGGFLVEGRHFCVFWEETGIYQIGPHKLGSNNKKVLNFHCL